GLVARSAAQGLGPAKDTLAQLDKLVSAQDRKKGVAIADAMAKRAGASAVASTSKSAKAFTKAAKPVETKIASAEPPKKAPQIAKSEPAAKPAAAPARPASVASSAPAATGAWRIQLGAFSQRANAESLYRKISGNGALSGRLPFYVAA